MAKKSKKNEKIDFQAGDLIEHTTQDFGRGRIMEVKDGVLTIAFKKAGKRRFPAGSRYLVLVEPDPKPMESVEAGADKGELDEKDTDETIED